MTFTINKYLKIYSMYKPENKNYLWHLLLFSLMTVHVNYDYSGIRPVLVMFIAEIDG